MLTQQRNKKIMSNDFSQDSGMNDDLTMSVKQKVKNIEISKGNRIFQDPNGRNPVCVPGVGTGICEWCGNKVIKITEPCAGVPPEERWSIRPE